MTIDKLIKANNIRIVGFEDYAKQGFMISLANAVYDTVNDCIAINDNPIPQPDYNRELVLLHEIAHWTGHPSRLNRITPTREAEELIADLAAHALGEKLNLPKDTLDNFLWKTLDEYSNVNLAYAYREVERIMGMLWTTRFVCEDNGLMSYWEYV